MIVTMKECFRASRFYREKYKGYISDELLFNVLMIKYKLLQVALTCFIEQFACTDLCRK